MPRKLRVEYPCALYHVMSRGDRREDVFLEDVDRHDFLKILAEASQKTGWQVHADCQREARRWAETDEEALKTCRRGWCLGGEAFKRQRLEQVADKLGEHHSGELRRATAEATTGRIVAEELSRLGWAEGDLATRRKSDPAKLRLAARLRAETTLTIKDIAR